MDQVLRFWDNDKNKGKKEPLFAVHGAYCEPPRDIKI